MGTKMSGGAGGCGPLRNEPVQARSAARLDALLDAAATVVDEVGFERLTTALVAERSGASIGTVYRYFPDRIALLQALGERNTQRLLAAQREVAEHHSGSLRDGVHRLLDVLISVYRSEPGFRSLRLGDVLAIPDSAERPAAKAVVAQRLAEWLGERHGHVAVDDLAHTLDVALEVMDALLARAFREDPHGDPVFIEQARRALDWAIDDDSAEERAA